MNKLYPYQEEGVQFLVRNRRAYLADEMGLGKTVQAIEAAHLLPGADRFKYAVVCPASVVENWRREWEAWRPTGWRTEPHVQSYTRLGMYGPDVGFTPDVLILDEAHYCKTPSANRTRAAMSLARRVLKNGGYVWCLSASPTPNDVTELWPILKTLWPELCEEWGTTTKDAFMYRFVQYTLNEYMRPKIWGLKEDARTVLKPALDRIMLRRKLADVALELPPLRFTVEYLPKIKDAREQIEALADPGDNPTELATLRRLLGQIKAPLVGRRIAEDLREDPELATVVMYHHIATGEVLGEALDQFGVFGFAGQTPTEYRQEQIDRFQRGEGRVFLVQQQAGGTGITLHRASDVVLVEPSWSPADNVQAIKRIHRIGQDKPCRARIFAMGGTLDEALMATIKRKAKNIKEILDD